MVAMQIIDENEEAIMLIPTKLHRQGTPLYAVAVRNDHEAKQQWKMIEAELIGECFMTADALRESTAL